MPLRERNSLRRGGRALWYVPPRFGTTMPQFETGLEGVIIALVLRLIFRFDIEIAFVILAGVGSRVMTAYFGPSFVPPDWWIAEMVVASAVTLAILGSVQLARAA